MPKMKTRRSAAKRFKITGSGKVRRHKSHHSHLLTHKSTKRKRQLRKDKGVSVSDMPRIRLLLPGQL